jgi:hypothetical protein
MNVFEELREMNGEDGGLALIPNRIGTDNVWQVMDVFNFRLELGTVLQDYMIGTGATPEEAVAAAKEYLKGAER